MQVLDWTEINAFAVKQIGKPAVYVSNQDSDDNVWQFVIESMKTIYGDKTPEFYDVLSYLISGGLFFFDTVEEQKTFYNVFEQPLTDSSSIYACTYDKNGECITENT